MSIEAMKQALEALRSAYSFIPMDTMDKHQSAESALRQAIDQAEKQEPVIGTKTWFEDGKMVTQHLYASDISQERVDETAKNKHEFECPRCGHCCQQREWVGLTDGEMVDLLKKYEGRLWVDVFRVIEAKLKEKNT